MHVKSMPFAFCSVLGCGALGLFWAGAAHAGGFEFPANGTEALGRGGAFTAKADSPLALEYNVAGLAGQRGTRLLFDNNLHFGRFAFQRAGAYPLVEDVASKPFYAPWFGLSSDFGYFDRWTFALGAFGPSSIGKRSYDPQGPARYDVVSTDTTVFLPTAAAAVKINRFFDLGLGLHLAFGNFNLSSTTFVRSNATPEGSCRDRLEDPRCDNRTLINVRSSINPLLSLGLLLHPVANLHAGIHIRSGANLGAKPIEATGTLLAVSPNGTEFGPEDATFQANLPWIFRVGIRYAFGQVREIADLELNFTYEAWSLSEGEGSRLMAPSPLNPNNLMLNILLPHYYKDTFSVRLGGSFSQPAGPALLTLRAGFLFDSSATDTAYTRLDFNTLAKLGGTVGLGVRYRGVTLNVAYAYLSSLTRTVEDGQIRAIDAGTGGPVRDNKDQIAPAVNNGTYEGNNQIVSLGLQVLFEELVRGSLWTRGQSR